VVAVKEPSKSLGDEYRDVIIDIQEKGTGTARLFFGYNSSDSVYGGLDISENNFNHKGLLTWWHQGISKIRGGGERVNLKAQIDYTIQLICTNYCYLYYGGGGKGTVEGERGVEFYFKYTLGSSHGTGIESGNFPEFYFYS
jgi:hypothetical protein